MYLSKSVWFCSFFFGWSKQVCFWSKLNILSENYFKLTEVRKNSQKFKALKNKRINVPRKKKLLNQTDANVSKYVYAIWHTHNYNVMPI